MAAMLDLPVVAVTGSLTVSRESVKTLVIEASGLNGFDRCRRVYPDAADVGIKLRSPRTGRDAVWVLKERHENNDHEITHWEFVPAPEAVYKTPALAGWTLIVYND